jgi:hypothetical protein
MYGVETVISRALQTRRGRAVVAVGALLLGAGFMYVGWPDVRDVWRLEHHHATADAEVVNRRTMKGDHYETIYDLRYRFQAPGRGDQWFTRTERSTGRSDLWITLDEDEWNKARNSGQVAVLYVLDDPRINRPASKESSSKADAWTGLIMGTVLAAAGLGWLSAEIISGVFFRRHDDTDSQLEISRAGTEDR